MSFLVLYFVDNRYFQMEKDKYLLSKRNVQIENNLIISYSFPWNVKKTSILKNDLQLGIQFNINENWEGNVCTVTLLNNDVNIILQERAIAPATGVYYASNDTCIVASDDLNSVVEAIGSTQLNVPYLTSCALFGTDYLEGTPYVEVHRLPTGHQVETKGYQWEAPRRFYFPNLNVDFPSLEEAEMQIFEQLSHSINCSLNNEESIGVFFSGGVDSTSVLSFLTELNSQKSIKKNILCISWHSKSQNGVGNEMGLINHAKEFYKINGVLMRDADLFNISNSREILKSIGQWLPVPSGTEIHAERTLKIHELCKMHGIKRIITGQGGDFMFDYKRNYFFNRNLWDTLKNCYKNAIKHESNLWGDFIHSYLVPLFFKHSEKFVLSYNSGGASITSPAIWREALYSRRVFLNNFVSGIKEPSVIYSLWESLCLESLNFLRSNYRLVHPFMERGLLELVLKYSIYSQRFPLPHTTFKPLLLNIMSNKLPPQIASRKGKSRVDWVIIDELKVYKNDIFKYMENGWLVGNHIISFDLWRKNFEQTIEGKKSGIGQIIQPMNLELWLREVANV